MRRRIPWWVLAVLFIGVPVLEIYLIVQLGQVIGPWWTILVLIADGVLGSYLVKREGSRAWRALRQALQENRMPAKELADGALILVGGTLLLTPGFVTDAVGLFCILPFTRPLARRVLARAIARRLGGGPVRFDSTSYFPPGATRRGPAGPGPVVEGQVIDGDPDDGEPPGAGRPPRSG